MVRIIVFSGISFFVSLYIYLNWNYFEGKVESKNIKSRRNFFSNDLSRNPSFFPNDNMKEQN